MFSDLCKEGGDAVQANQFLIVHRHTGAIIDPGGNLAHGELYLGMSRHFPPNRLSAILASHADPGIIASLDRWMTATSDAKLYVSMLDGAQAARAIRSLSPMPPGMEAFHRRYMVSNKILRLWARMIRTLPIDMTAPQHGAPLVGEAVEQFIDWVETLACGVDLMDESIYTVPL